MSGTRLDERCASLPEAVHVVVADRGGRPTWRVAGTVFAVGSVSGASAVVKVGRDVMEPFVAADPRVTVAASISRHGWVSVDLEGGEVDGACWDEVEG